MVYEAKRCVLTASSLCSLQLNLVYVIGVAPSIAKETLLERQEYFGQYGRVVKLVVNRQALPGGGGTETRSPSSSA